MHEMSVCQALLTQTAEISAAQGAVAIQRITIEVGPLSGTDPVLLLNAFLAMRCGAASEAELRFEPCAVRISCLECGAQGETRPNRLICARCGGFRAQIIAGDSLRLLRVEMRMVEQLTHV